MRALRVGLNAAMDIEDENEGPESMEEAAAPAAGSPRLPAAPWSRTHYNLLYRVLGSRPTAKKVMRLLAERPCPPDRPTLIWLRDLTREALGPRVLAGTLFSAGHNLLERSPDPEELPHLGPGFDVPALERDVKEALNPQVLVMLELLFVDRFLPGEVAELAGVSPAEVLRHVTSLIIALGRLDIWRHTGEDCAPVERTVQERLFHRLGVTLESGEVTEDTGEDDRCTTCEAAMRMATDVLDLFSRDSRILSFSDPRLIAKALESPTIKIDSENPAPRPLPRKGEGDAPAMPKTLPDPSYRAWYGAAGAAALAFFYVTFSTMSSFIWGSAAQTGRFQRGLVPVAKPVGNWTDLTGGSGPLAGDSDLGGSQASPTYLTFDTGVQGVLSPGGKTQVRSHGVVLEAGRLHVRVMGSQEDEFLVKIGDLTARTREGEFDAVADPASDVRFEVKIGTVEVLNAKGEVHSLRAGQRMRLGT